MCLGRETASSSTVLKPGNCKHGKERREAWLTACSHEIPHTLRQLFNSSMSPEWRIASPYCLALAPQIDSPEPIWYAGCKTLDGEDKLCKCLPRPKLRGHETHGRWRCGPGPSCPIWKLIKHSPLANVLRCQLS